MRRVFCFLLAGICLQGFADGFSLTGTWETVAIGMVEDNDEHEFDERWFYIMFEPIEDMGESSFEFRDDGTGRMEEEGEYEPFIWKKDEGIPDHEIGFIISDFYFTGYLRFYHIDGNKYILFMFWKDFSDGEEGQIIYIAEKTE
jgi:hypothetical protein